MLRNCRRRSGDGNGGWGGNHRAERRSHGAEKPRRARFRIWVKDPRSNHDGVFPRGVLSKSSLGPERHTQSDNRSRQQRNERLRSGAQAALDRRCPRQPRSARDLALGADVGFGRSRLLPLFAAGLACGLLAVAAEGANRAHAAGDATPGNHHSLCRSTASSDPILRTLQATPRQHNPSPTSLYPNVEGARSRLIPPTLRAARDTFYPSGAGATIASWATRRRGARGTPILSESSEPVRPVVACCPAVRWRLESPRRSCDSAWQSNRWSDRALHDER